MAEDITTNVEIEANKFFEIKKVGPLITNVFSGAILVGVILTLAYLIWGAIDWIMSEGDKQKYETARNKITHAVIGLVILALIWLVWRLILLFLGIGNIGGNQVKLNL
jgi:hypothetical protein